MFKVPWLEDEKFWKTLKFLESVTSEISVFEACMQLDIDEEQLLEVIYYLHNINIEYGLELREEKKYLIPPKKKVAIKVEFTLSEWVALQAHFPVLSGLGDSPYNETLLNKLTKIEKKYQDYDLFSAVSSVRSNPPENCDENIIFHQLKFIENCILEKHCVKANIQTSEVEFFPHKMVFITGDLSLIVEDLKDGCLTHIKINELLECHYSITENYVPKYTLVEVNSFIKGLKSMAENQMRLVLKIKGHCNLEFPHPYHFFGSPYVVTNHEGDFIWGATVEPSEDLYNWLSSLGDDVQVLDPPEFKKAFQDYIDGKSLKKAA